MPPRFRKSSLRSRPSGLAQSSLALLRGQSHNSYSELRHQLVVGFEARFLIGTSLRYGELSLNKELYRALCTLGSLVTL